MSLTVMLTNLNAINDRARDVMLANSIAENKIESLRSGDFVALSDGTVDFSDELPATFGSPRSASYIVSTLNVAVKQVDIEITYAPNSLSSETFNYTSYIGELGVGQ